jgi:hypothetical protein
MWSERAKAKNERYDGPSTLNADKEQIMQGNGMVNKLKSFCSEIGERETKSMLGLVKLCFKI